jgi:hypothetical protein
MLRLIIAVFFFMVFFGIIVPRIRRLRALKREHHARYNKDEWEKIKRELENK